MTKKESEEEKINTAALYHGPKSDVGSVFLFFTPGSSQKEISSYILQKINFGTFSPWTKICGRLKKRPND